MGEVAQGNARLFSYRGGTLARRASPAASTKRFEAARNRARAHLAAAACGNACGRNCQSGTRARRAYIVIGSHERSMLQGIRRVLIRSNYLRGPNLAPVPVLL